MTSPFKLAAIGLVCAVPFGLAIRDEVSIARSGSLAGSIAGSVARSGGDQSIPPLDRLAPHDSELTDRPAARPQPAAALPSRSAVLLDPLTGPAAAELGALFDGVALGASSQDFLPSSARRRIESFKARHPVGIDFDFDERELLAVTLILPDPVAVRDALTARWGTPVGERDLRWFDGRGTSATLTPTGDTAELRFLRHGTVEQLVAPADPSRLGIEPFPVLGARLEALAAVLGTRLEQTDESSQQYVWREPGLPTSDARTVATVVVVNGVITELVVETGGRHADELRAALVAKYGAPSEHDGEPWQRARWKGRRMIEVAVDELGARIAVHR